MRKKLALLLVLVMISAIMLSACGSKGGSGIGGTTWKLTELVSPQATLNAEQLKENNLVMTFEFNKDGTVVSSVSEDKANWKQDGDEITISADGGSQKIKIDGDTFTLEMDGAKMVFTKQ